MVLVLIWFSLPLRCDVPQDTGDLPFTKPEDYQAFRKAAGPEGRGRNECRRGW